MAKLIRYMAVVLILLGSSYAAVFLWIAGFIGKESVTLASLSPDDQRRVWLIELPRLVDRNFELRLEDLNDSGKIHSIFISPDESRPVGSERIYWSKDSRYFVLLGRHFNVEADAVLPNGEQLYLLYDTKTGELRCNARHLESKRFTLEDAGTLIDIPEATSKK